MTAKKLGLGITAVACLMLAFYAVSESNTATAQGGKKPVFNGKKLKLIVNKVDPEIRAAQKALGLARTDLMKARSAIMKAMNDEVFGEKGATEGLVLDRLKQSLAACNRAIADVNVSLQRANLAQLIDKGGD